MEVNSVIPSDFAQQWLVAREHILSRAAAIKSVSGDVELDIAGAREADIKKAIKKLETERKTVTVPLDDIKKEIMAREKSLILPLTKELNRIHALTTAYATMIAKKREEEIRAREAAEAAAAEAAVAAEEADPFGFNGEPESVVVPTPMPITNLPRTSVNRLVMKWEFKVVDEHAVPRELCSVDERKVRAFLNAKKIEGYKADQIKVAGLNIFSTVQVYSR